MSALIAISEDMTTEPGLDWEGFVREQAIKALGVTADSDIRIEEEIDLYAHFRQRAFRCEVTA